MQLRSAVFIGMLMLGGLAAPPALSNPEPEADVRDFAGGNAIDRLGVIARMPYQFLPRQYWATKYMLSTVEGRILLYRYWLFRQMYWRPSAPAAAGGAALPPQPDLDAPPAESFLDQIDESDAAPLLVGEPGTRLQSLDAMGEIPSPPPESILDQIEDSPKPAVNQATPPKLVEAPR